MWRISSTSFSSPAHEQPGWVLLRKQLSTASLRRDSGDVPPLALLVDEVTGMARYRRETGQLPFGGRSGAASYTSLTADLDDCVDRLGPRLEVLSATTLQNAYDSGWSAPSRGAKPPWQELFGAADELAKQLRAPEVLMAAFLDAVDAAALERVEDALIALAPRLDELRAIAELQRGPWERTLNTIGYYLTAGEARKDGGPMHGRHVKGTDPQVVFSGLRSVWEEPVLRQEWAVWLSTLAGPSPDDAAAAVISGPIAISGEACTGEIEPWLSRVRDELAAAFTNAGQEVPPDVMALGEPERHQGIELLGAEQLWSHTASPPSFVARVAVNATSSTEAIRQAREALRAVYGFADPALPGDVRPDAVVWTARGGWALPMRTASGRSVGELRASRYATRAVAGWAEDLGSPLDAEKLDLLRSRALVNTASVAPEVRLMRAFSSLESLTPADRKLDDVAQHLWRWTLLGEAREVLRHLVNNVRDPSSLGPPRDGAGWEERKRRIDKLTNSPLRWDLGLLDAIDEVLEVVHPDAIVPALARATRSLLTDPTAVTRARSRHAAAIRRARRHRNLTTHGHRLSDKVLEPTVAFLADQLEWAIAARGSPAEDAWLGALATPSAEPAPADIASLLDR